MKIFIVAGDPSGDLHGWNLAKEIKRIQPQAQIFSAGGDNLARESVQVLNLVDIAVTGIFEIITYMNKILKMFGFLKEKIIKVKPDIIVLIDFPDFNLRLARALKPKGFRIFYYISPQIWAWRRKRINIIKKYVDKMMVIFPFEEEFYKQRGVSALYVGHPLTEVITAQTLKREPERGEQKIIALLPGSREKEVRKHLPLMFKAKDLLKEYNLKFTIIKHPQLSFSLFSDAEKERVPIEALDAYRTLSKAYLAIASSGTATLELALLEIPSVAIYKMGASTFLVLKNMVKVDYISMANIIAKERVFPEFIQYQATPENIASACKEFLENKELYRRTKEKLKKIRNILGQTSASANAAREIVNALQNP